MKGHCILYSAAIISHHRASHSRRRVLLGFLTALAAILSCTATSFAENNKGTFPKRDIPGSADHPLLKRFEGSYIVYYARKAYDSYNIGLEKVMIKTPYNSQNVEDSHTTLIYALPQDTSTFEAIPGNDVLLPCLGNLPRPLSSCQERFLITQVTTTIGDVPLYATILSRVSKG
jgi:hypothetical protein